MDEYSEENIRKNCPHCDIASQAYVYVLEETTHFRIICDGHPLVEGHLLIIPKKHVSCIAEYTSEMFEEFLVLYEKCQKFVKKEYGSIATFEHGVFGQTVFHSHVHVLPFSGEPLTIITEGKDRFALLSSLGELKKLFKLHGGYLFFSIDAAMWNVDPALAAPRFFRDRFAQALGRSERGDWKAMHFNKELMQITDAENRRVKEQWLSTNFDDL